MTALPSDVVAVIDQFFPWVANAPDSVSVFLLSDGDCTNLETIIQLADAIPPHLILLSGMKIVAYVSSLISIREDVAAFRRATLNERKYDLIQLHNLDKFGYKSPIVVLRSCLANCPDSLPVPGTSDLPFFSNDEIRSALHSEISDVEQALRQRDWKAATVLGGAALEAILFWSLKGLSTELAALPDKPSEPFTKWELKKHIDVARKLGIIEERTKKQADLARDVRNLVHPARVLESQQECDKSSSHTVIAAIEAVVRDIGAFCNKNQRAL